MARPCLCVCVTPSPLLLVISHLVILSVFPFSRHYLHETRKKPIRLTYVAARLLLQRSLQSQFWHSYSRVRIFMIMPVKYATVEEDNPDRREIDSISDTRKRIVVTLSSHRVKAFHSNAYSSGYIQFVVTVLLLFFWLSLLSSIPPIRFQ